MNRRAKAMIRANLRLVINIAKRYLHLGIPLLDLIEEGNLGLMKAVDKYNPKKGWRFSTYGAWWIRQGIIRAIAQQGKLVRLPVYVNEMLSKWKKAREQLTQKLHRVPTDEEIARKIENYPAKKSKKSIYGYQPKRRLWKRLWGMKTKARYPTLLKIPMQYRLIRLSRQVLTRKGWKTFLSE